jgi:hypothetical protein
VIFCRKHCGLNCDHFPEKSKQQISEFIIIVSIDFVCSTAQHNGTRANKGRGGAEGGAEAGQQFIVGLPIFPEN